MSHAPSFAHATALKAPRKLVCLESYWDEELFQHFSVKAFLDGMAPLVHPPLTVAHRFVDSGAGLAYYLRRPGGVMWRQKALFDAPVYYLAFHGGPGSVRAVTERIGGDALIEAFAGYGDHGYRNLVYFAACSVFRGKRGLAFARGVPARDRRAGGRRLRHAGRLDGEPGLRSAVPAPFLRRPCAVEESAASIFNSVHRDYPAARRLKHMLITRKDLMTLNVRRVITDHDARANPRRDRRALRQRYLAPPGHESCVAWQGRDGTIFRIVEYQPGVAPRMHRTETIDYAVVISGEIDMTLDIGHRAPARRRRAGAAGDAARLDESRQRSLPHRLRARADEAARARRKGPACGGLAHSSCLFAVQAAAQTLSGRGRCASSCRRRPPAAPTSSAACSPSTSPRRSASSSSSRTSRAPAT